MTNDRSLRIFLSYGHDSNEELVKLIKADLEKRGHDVWIDRSEIKFGDDWRRSITDGVVGSNLFFAFLSKYSTRDPGVCLDEIAIAIGVKGGNIQTILVESENEVKPPTSISHIQWLDMHDWKDQRVAGENIWVNWYHAKLSEIIQVVESDESRRFAGEIEVLSRYLKPISSDSRIYGLLRKGFVGRTWLIDAIEKWRNSVERTSRLFWIIGNPGAGKSAFAAHLAHYASDKVIAAQFVEWDKGDHRKPERVIRSIAFQIATRLPDYRKLLLMLPEIEELDLKDSAELFDYLLANPLSSVIYGERERYLILIDALDEAGEIDRNLLVEMLALNIQRLPDWIGLIVTSRPEYAVKTPLQGLKPFILDTQTEDNRSDIRNYVNLKLASQLEERADAGQIVEQILEKSEGLFLYIEQICIDIQRGHISLDDSAKFPEGLGGIYFQYFRRQFPDLGKFRNEVRPVLRAILAARGPLPIKMLYGLFDKYEEEFNDFIYTICSLFPVTFESGIEVIRPYHKSLADWLTNGAKSGLYFISLDEGNKLLAKCCWEAYKKGIGSMNNYEIRFAIFHLEKAGFTDHVLKLREDKVFQKLNLELEIEANDPKYQKFIKISARQADLKNELQVLLNKMGLNKRWHPQPALLYKELGPQEDYSEVYLFPCCGLFVIVGDWNPPSQYRADGCRATPS
jgi:hypothetical protein